MSFCDQTILSDPFADSNAVLASGTSPVQESDFAPKPNSSFKPEFKPDSESMLQPILENPADDPADELKKSSNAKIDEAIEMLDADKEKEKDKEQDKPDPIEKLGSDDPVKAPTFELTDESSDKSPTKTERETETESEGDSSKPVQHNFSDEAYQLPTVADVRSPISSAPLGGTSQSDPSGLLQDVQGSNFYQRYANPASNYAEISGMPSAAKFKTWQAHDVYHRPTYFEDQNLELNGNQRPFQNVASAVSFFGTIPRLPYLFGEHHPQEKIFTLGEDRPGDPAPFRIYQQTGNRKGRALQTIATLGLILP